MDTNEKSLETAVLFITYKRLDTTKKVFEAIKKAKPQKIYISSNFLVKIKKKLLRLGCI